MCLRYAHGVVPKGEFTSLSVGIDHSCAIHRDKTVTCWGDEWHGRASPPDGEFTAVVTRSRYTCGLRTDGEIECWGLKEDEYCYGPEIIDEFTGGPPCHGWGVDPFPPGPYVSIAASVPISQYRYPGPQPICAVRPDGDFTCSYGAARKPPPPEGSFEAIDSGSSTTCALDGEGEITCWGGDLAGFSVPEGPFESFSVGDYHGCGLRSDGEVECWGWNSRGEADAPAGPFVAVDAGVLLSCGLRPGGDAECWGEDSWWLHSPPPGPFTDLAVGDGSACGRRPGGTLDCWGRRREGPIPEGRFKGFSLNDHACGLRLDGTPACADKPDNRSDYWFYDPEYSVFHPDVAEHSPGGVFASLSGWGSHACGLRPNGAVDCWDSQDDWRATSPTGGFTAISAEAGEGCGIRPDKTLECWSVWEPPEWGRPEPGTDRTPQGTLTVATSPEPTYEPLRGVPWGLEWVSEAPPPGPFSTIDSGDRRTCGLTLRGSVYCWGHTSSARGGPYIDIQIGGLHPCPNESVYNGCAAVACGVRPGGDPHCWSANRQWRQPRPQWLEVTDRPVAALDVGFGACAILAAGGIACVDRVRGSEGTEYGFTGIPSWWEQSNAIPNTGVFQKVSIGYGWLWPGPERQPSSGAGSGPAYVIPIAHEHACSLSADGEIACWGTNNLGQAETPPSWLDLAPYRDVAAGFAHTCALDRSGEALCWGDNRFGQLDAPVGALTQISAGQWHTCGLRPDGEIDCWGDGNTGQRSGHDEPPEGAPTQPPEGPFVEVSAGQWHTCALRADGSVACWYSY